MNLKFKMQNDDSKLKINKFKLSSLQGVERRSNPLFYFVIASPALLLKQTLI
jgi:hypothetical protein